MGCVISSPNPDLSDGVVVLRRWSMEDVDCIAEASTDPRIPAGTTVPADWSPQAGRAFIERQWRRAEDGEGLSLAVHSVELGRAVGLLAMMLRPQIGVTGLGYWIVPTARGRGYATRSVSLASTWAIGAGGFARIEAWVEPTNLASQAVLSAAGFEREGHLRSFLTIGDRRSDAIVYSRIAAT
jgi:RimJ/RimL family protein N-acetyltransferase